MIEKCPVCGTPLRSGETTCPVCGTDLSFLYQTEESVDEVIKDILEAPEEEVIEEEIIEEYVCPVCGKEVGPDDTVCPHCGAVFEEEEVVVEEEAEGELTGVAEAEPAVVEEPVVVMEERKKEVKVPPVEERDYRAEMSSLIGDLKKIIKVAKSKGIAVHFLKTAIEEAKSHASRNDFRGAVKVLSEAKREVEEELKKKYMPILERLSIVAKKDPRISTMYRKAYALLDEGRYRELDEVIAAIEAQARKTSGHIKRFLEKYEKIKESLNFASEMGVDISPSMNWLRKAKEFAEDGKYGKAIQALNAAEEEMGASIEKVITPKLKDIKVRLQRAMMLRKNTKPIINKIRELKLAKDEGDYAGVILKLREVETLMEELDIY